MKKIKLDDYIKLLTDYHSGGSYKTLKENTKILHKPDYAVMIRTLNFERNDFKNDLIYCDEASYNFLEYSHVVENDILMNKIANPGSVYIMPKVNYNCTCGMNLFLIRFENINQRYMYYVMKNNEGYIKSKAHGTTTKTITKDEVRDLEFKIHETKEEQDKVEKLLTNIDSKIELNTKVKDILEEMMKTLYQRWFLEFEFPNEEGKPYKSSGGKLVYNELLKRNIPEKWDSKNIMDFVTWEGTSQPPKSCFIYEYKEGYIRFIQNRDYDDSSHMTYIPENMALSKCNRYDILMDKYGDAGRTRFGLEGAYNVALSKISVDDVSYREYIRSVLNSESVYNYLHNSSMASTRASLNENNISYINIVVPDKNIIEQYNKFANNYIETQLQIYDENKRLTELRDYLLPMLMNGQINVDDVQI